ncbi:zinc finger MYM-type protein 1-like [Zingiber officinale]|uniref:zinc finger MYM-type protein 1-like n=1 Tax=Zingiber officinale TaxID=94328 RepID=UPI001C4B63B0|nr:zinc finger MYM-type protein 1-like [Zingiber officinale]
MNAPGNNQMIATKIQKQLVNACAVETTNAILADFGDRWFTLLLDEARDCSVKEQMAVVIRYVNKHGEVIERFMAVVHVVTTTAACLKEAIDSLFAKYGLSVARLRGQEYDGASNMSGEFNGLKSLIMKENPYALYVHCFAHQLQLVVVAVAQANQYVCDFMWIVGSIVNTSASSCKRADKLRQLEHDRKVKLLERGEISSGRGLNQETSLARPGDTRWGSHHSTLCRIEQMWPFVIEVLQNLIDDGDRSSKSLSRTLVERMERYEFVFILLLMKRILAITNHLSTVLQEKDQNIVNAMHLINNVKCKLQKLRDSGWDILLEDVKKFCNTHSIEIINMTDNINSRSRLKRDGKNVNFYHYYHVEIFYEVIDIILQEMDSRFSETTTDLLIYMTCLDPRNSFSRFDVQKLVRLAHFYEDDFSWNERMLVEQELETYIDDVRSDERFEGISDLRSLAKKMIEIMKNRVFPLVYQMIELALLLPVATATVERVFSAMNIVKIDLRNRIRDEWMNDGLIVYIEKDIFNTVDNEPILQRANFTAFSEHGVSKNNCGCASEVASSIFVVVLANSISRQGDNRGNECMIGNPNCHSVCAGMDIDQDERRDEIGVGFSLHLEAGMRRGRAVAGSRRGPGRSRKQPIEAEEPEPVTQEAESSRDPTDVETVSLGQTHQTPRDQGRQPQEIPSVIPSGRNREFQPQGIPSGIPSAFPTLATTDWMRDRARIPLLARSVKDRFTLYLGGADPWAA